MLQNNYQKSKINIYKCIYLFIITRDFYGDILNCAMRYFPENAFIYFAQHLLKTPNCKCLFAISFNVKYFILYFVKVCISCL